MGDHRLLCGDATVRTEVDRFMGTDKGDLVLTDPPYNVDYEGYTEVRLTIKGDRMSSEQFERFLQDTFSSYRGVLKPGASLYVCHSSSWQREFQNASSQPSLKCDVRSSGRRIRSRGIRKLKVST
jgi:DNA modification methylase